MDFLEASVNVGWILCPRTCIIFGLGPRETALCNCCGIGCEKEPLKSHTVLLQAVAANLLVTSSGSTTLDVSNDAVQSWAVQHMHLAHSSWHGV
jgi:hypothetical protein